MSAPGVHAHRAGPALRALAETDPALAALSLWCAHRDGDVTRTTGQTITYGADFADLALHEQIGLAAHHVLHVALRHPARLNDLRARLGAGFEEDLYNLAADAMVNEALLAAEYALPRPAVTLSGLLARALKQEVAPEVALREWDVDRLYFALVAQGQGEGRGRAAAEAARAYARAQAFEADLEGSDGHADAPDNAEEAARWRQHLTRAMDAGRQAGRGIGRIGHMLADVPEPQTPWEVILRRAVTRAVTVLPQPTPMRPARRWIAGAAQAELAQSPVPGFEPGQRIYSDVARIVVALDASGSIDDARLALFWAEVTGIARRMRAEVHLLVFDDGIRHSARIDPTQSGFPVPQMPRGGGTDFRPVMAEALALRAAVLVVLTDLEGDTGPRPRGLPVIWAVPEGSDIAAPFGQVIDLTR